MALDEEEPTPVTALAIEEAKKRDTLASIEDSIAQIGDVIETSVWCRPPVAVREALERIAVTERRSMAATVVVLLEEALAARRKARRTA